MHKHEFMRKSHRATPVVGRSLLITSEEYSAFIGIQGDRTLPPEDLWICPVCGAKFSSLTRLMEHLLFSNCERHVRARHKIKLLSRSLGLHRITILRELSWIRV